MGTNLNMYAHLQRQWESRAPDDRAYHRRVQRLVANGLLADVKLWEGGTHYGLEVKPVVPPGGAPPTGVCVFPRSL